ncbi:SHC3 protein, partial [Hippolais icterina]|nr:SHC3 protein [Hippolais icterina]
MLQRTKYNRFRNDSVTSVDDLIHNLPMNSKVSAVSTTSASASPSYLVSPESLCKDQEDGPTTLCTLIHKVPHLKLSSSGSFWGIKNFSAAVKELAVSKLQGSSSASSSAAGASHNTCNLVSATSCSQQDVSKMSMGKKAQSEEMHLGSEDWNQTSSFVNKSSQGWLHSSEKILGPGVTYIVKYLGCIEVLRSMRSLDFSTRMQVARSPLILHTMKIIQKIQKTKICFFTPSSQPTSKVLSSILGKSNLQFAGMSIMLNISTSSLNLMNPDTKQIIANHHMQSISFASGGDPDTSDYVAYVAKDPVNRRACHILECCDGLAQDVISTIGQAFELRFKQYLQCPSKICTFPDRMQSFEDPWTEEDNEAERHYYNNIPNKISPPGGFLDARLKTRLPTAADTAESASGVGGEQIYYQSHHLGKKFSEDWHHEPVKQGFLDICSMSEEKSEVAPTAELPIYVNTQHINREDLLGLHAEAGSTFSGIAEDAEAASQGKDLFDMKPFEDALKNQTSEAMLKKSTSMGCTSPLLSRVAVQTEAEELSTEPWYQGEMSRKEAEQLLKKCGDFLVRKSTTNPDSYVLTGMHKGQAKHLLLVDPEGTVRTKDRVFDSISHLINYHLENNLPIVSSVSELCLQQPAERKH